MAKRDLSHIGKAKHEEADGDKREVESPGADGRDDRELSLGPGCMSNLRLTHV